MAKLPRAELELPTKTFKGTGALERAFDGIRGRFDTTYEELGVDNHHDAVQAIPGDAEAVFEGNFGGKPVRAPGYIESVHTDDKKGTATAVFKARESEIEDLG